MSTAHVAAMIDHLVERYGLTGAGARSRCLKWLQLAEEETWSAGDWWFKQQRDDVPMSGGTTEYALSTGTARLFALERGDGSAMRRLHPDDFRALAGSDATSGYPELYCHLEPSATGYFRVKVWPVPLGVETLKAVYSSPPKTLADSTESVSGLPSDWRYLVLLRAEVYASLHLGQAGQAEGFLGRYQEGLSALVRDAAGQMVRS